MVPGAGGGQAAADIADITPSTADPGSDDEEPGTIEEAVTSVEV